MEAEEFIGITEELDEKELQKYAHLVENDEEDEKAQVDVVPTRVRVVNIVACVDFGCQLNLYKIATHLRNSEYNPKRFPAVTIRIAEPKATGLTFKNGKMNIVGCKTEESAYLAARKFGRVLKNLSFPVTFKSFKIANIVAVTSTNFPIHLESIAAHPQHKLYSVYNPEIFAGLIFRVMKPRATLLIFVSGQIVITGTKTIDEVNEAVSFIHPILEMFAKKPGQSQAAI